MKNKYKLQTGIMFGVLAISPLFCNSCATGRNEISTSTIDNMGLNDLWNNGNNIVSAEIIDSKEITSPIEKIELNNGVVEYKVQANYIPYQVEKEYNMPGMIGVTETTDEYKILTMPYIKEDEDKVAYTLDGAIGVYKPYAHLLTNKELILSKYGLSINDEISDYSFASLEDRELLEKIDQLETIVMSSYEEVRSLKLAR